jgi:hypothetical protein
MHGEPGRISQKADIMRDVYEVLDDDGRWLVTGWPKLQQSQRAKLESKLDMLRRAEVDPKTRQANLPQDLLAGPNVYGQPWIYKLKVKGNVALRPMICLGPTDHEKEWTVLARATEKDMQLIPADAADTAELRRGEVKANRRKRQKLGATK